MCRLRICKTIFTSARFLIVIIIIVWIWSIIGSILTICLLGYIHSIPLTFNEIANFLDKKPYLASYAELIGIGLLPLIISLVCKDNFKLYGICRKGMIKSLLYSIPIIVFVITNQVITHRYMYVKYVSFNLPFSLNIWYAIFAIITYGLLEVFFVFWLIVNTDRVFKTVDKMWSPGLFVTVIVFGFSHLVLSPKAGVLNAISVTIIFLILSIIFKTTKNILGPAICWTLLNGQVVKLVVGCLS